MRPPSRKQQLMKELIRIRTEQAKSTQEAYKMLDEHHTNLLESNLRIESTLNVLVEKAAQEELAQNVHREAEKEHWEAFKKYSENVASHSMVSKTHMDSQETTSKVVLSELKAGDKRHSKILNQKVGLILGGSSSAFLAIMSQWVAAHLNHKDAQDGYVWAGTTMILVAYLVMARMITHYYV